MQELPYEFRPELIPAIQLKDGDIVSVSRNVADVGRAVVTGVRETPKGVSFQTAGRRQFARPADPVRLLVPVRVD